MKAKINEIYRRPYPTDFIMHMRNELGLTDEYKKVMDSLREHLADSKFHYQYTMIPDAKFERILKKLTDCQLTELIRLATVGLRTENQTKTNKE